jgi:hypothetical protein
VIPRALALAVVLAGCREPTRNELPESNVAHDANGDSTIPVAHAPPPAPPRLAVRDVYGVGLTFLARMEDDSLRAWGSNAFELIDPTSASKRFATPVTTDIRSVGPLVDASYWLGDGLCWQDRDAAVRCRGDRVQSMLEWLGAEAPYERATGLASFGVDRAWSCAASGTPQTLTCRGDPGTGFDRKPLPEAFVVSSEIDGIDLTFEHGCALHRDGTVTCWGSTGFGRIGHGRVIAPSQSWEQLPRKIGSLDDAVELVVVDDLSCARRRSGRIHCWGEPFARPMDVHGIANAKRLVGEGQRICVLTEDGQARCLASAEPLTWRASADDDPSEHAQLLTPLIERDDLVAIALGDKASCALVESGEVLCWGRNHYGQLGDGSLIDRQLPAPVLHLRDVELPPPSDGAKRVPESSIVQSWTELPPECVHQAQPEVRVEKLGVTSFEVRSAFATISEPSKYLSIRLADHHALPSPDYPFETGPRGHQRMISIGIDTPSTGRHEFAPNTTDPPVRISVFDQDESFPLGGYGSEGFVELTRVDDDWVCGRVEVKRPSDSGGTDSLVTRFAARRIPEPTSG